MLDSSLCGRDALVRIINTHVSGRADHTTVIWALLVFEGFLQITDATALSRPEELRPLAEGCAVRYWP